MIICEFIISKLKKNYYEIKKINSKKFYPKNS